MFFFLILSPVSFFLLTFFYLLPSFLLFHALLSFLLFLSLLFSLISPCSLFSYILFPYLFCPSFHSLFSFFLSFFFISLPVLNFPCLYSFLASPHSLLHLYSISSILLSIICITFHFIIPGPSVSRPPSQPFPSTCLFSLLPVRQG